MIWKVLLFTITYRAVSFKNILNVLQQRNNISVWNTNKTETFLDAIYQWGGTCTLQTWDIQEEVCTWCPDHNCDISQLLTSGDQLCGGSSQSIERLYKWWHHCKLWYFVDSYLDGEHLGWKYELLSITPDWAKEPRWGVIMSGLCQETSFHPRSSAIITTKRTKIRTKRLIKDLVRIMFWKFLLFENLFWTSWVGGQLVFDVSMTYNHSSLFLNL